MCEASRQARIEWLDAKARVVHGAQGFRGTEFRRQQVKKPALVTP